MQTRVTIIYPTDPYYPKVGGVAMLIKGFVKYAPKDLDIEFIGTSSDLAARPLKQWTPITIEGRTVNYLPVLLEKDENIKTKIPLTFRFTWALSRLPIDYSNKLLFFNTIEPSILFVRQKCPKVLIIHNDIEQQMMKAEGEMLWRKIPWLYFQFEKSIMPSIDQVYTESGKTVAFYHRKYTGAQDKFTFLPTWVDTDIFTLAKNSKRSIREALRSTEDALPLDAQWILFTGRLQKQKNPRRMVEAFHSFRKTNQNSALILVGGGNMQPEIERYAEELGIRKHIYFIPQKHQRELVSYYQAADVFLLASNFEGMSVSVLEALACGLPVVSTDAGEARRVIKSGFSGEVINDFSPERLAQELEKVLSRPDIYTGPNCIQAVSEYAAEKVLAPLYERMRQLYAKKCRFATDNEKMLK